jgi:hypothetical protein
MQTVNKIHILLTECIHVIRRTNSDYLLKQHYQMIFVMRTRHVCFPVGSQILNSLLFV